MKTTTRTLATIPVSRRGFLGVSALTTAAWATGCATNPVSGRRQLMFLTPENEIRIDRQQSPHQFSADYGAIQDARLQAYLQEITVSIAATTHRPELPYSGVGLNASYVNGYTFPAGSIGITRGLLAQMQDEASLAALIGHELGHVNARHTAQRMSKGLVTTVMLAGASIAVAANNEDYAPLILGLGSVGTGALLAKYSRDDEREADALGMEYMVAGGYTPMGMVSLMEVLRSLGRNRPNVIEMMFASHPMSDERHATAVRDAQRRFPRAHDQPTRRERYMDMIADLRAQRNMLEQIQQGDQAMREQKWNTAETQYTAALREGEADYEALMKMSKCQVSRKDLPEAQRFVERARSVYPGEPQSYQLGGVVALQRKRYEQALADFEHYEEKLPGNPLSDFLSGRALEGMGRRDAAAERYRAFLQQVASGEEADYARRRLAEWEKS